MISGAKILYHLGNLNAAVNAPSRIKVQEGNKESFTNDNWQDPELPDFMCIASRWIKSRGKTTGWWVGFKMLHNGKSLQNGA